ncbi:hypothetical protein RVR_8267 [Actinacidiphila reveromycinica]|uniref:Uncharacterized protein n=1 Tax=Actinacidiphila reveromycinica TaxID=659352 RepID=A0A7U3VRQ0_9ACTN|nr:helix-turn-helix domain-containing protein [Streptomyces sp. SN-593]BBB01035.1 hypothetical protein RVR_8267 [Streptomyces sp. SN-593]
MGYELRRQLREALGPDITGLQRAVALEIADDANDDTKESWVKLEDLARWTGAKDTSVVRNALKRLAAAGWEFRVPIGKGKDGRAMYAVPGRRMTFLVPPFEGVAVATPKGEPTLPHGGAPATPQAPQGGATAPSEGATAPSEGAVAPPFSSAPHSPQEEEASSAPSAVREISDADKVEFGNFWGLFPKSQNFDKTRDAWTAEVLAGADPKEITAAAVAYAHDQAGNDWQFVKSSAGWLRDKRYLDKHAPTPTGKPNLKAVKGSGHRPFQAPEAHVYHQQKGF